MRRIGRNNGMQGAATVTRRHGRALARIACTGALALGGCSTVLDKRPIATEPGFGIPFTATLEGVYIARVPGSAETEYRDVATAAARYQFAGTDPVGITISLLGDLVTSVTRATVSDTERRLASGRCVYVLRPKSRTLASGIRNTAFTATGTTGTATPLPSASSVGRLLDDVLEGAEPGRTPKDAPDAARQRADRGPIVEPDGDAGEEEEGGLVSLFQICNADLRMGEEVMVTITSNGGTIHPSMSETSKTVEDVMRRRNMLPDLPAGGPAARRGGLFRPVGDR